MNNVTDSLSEGGLMYEEYNAPLPDAEAYLERIGLGGEKVEHTAEWLDRLTIAQIQHIPFDNLDVWAYRACPSLAVNDLFQKIVVNKRGGYCFELNSIFKSFLQALGFDAYTVICHLMGRGGNTIGVPAHCAVIVRLDGKKYFIDVGYGGRVPNGAVLMDGEEHIGFRSGTQDFYAKVDMITEEGAKPFVLFKDLPALPVELVPLNFNVSQAPTSRFQNAPMLNMRYPNGSASVSGKTFKYTDGDVHEEFELTGREDLIKVAAKYFYMDPEKVPFREFDF